MITNPDNFFGIDTGEASYNSRRHFNIVYQAIIIYTYGIETVKSISERLSTSTFSQLSKWIHEEILNPEHRLFLKSLKDKLNISEDEYIKITGCIGCCDKIIKSPATYNSSQKMKLLIHLAIVYNKAELLSSLMLSKFIDQWCESFNVTKPGFYERIAKLSKQGVKMYGVNQLELIEEFVLSNLGII